MTKLEEIISLCKADVDIMINSHKSEYSTVEESIGRWLNIGSIDESDIPQEMYKNMVESDTIVDIKLYKDTPVGFIHILDYNIENALDRALKALKK